MALKWILNNFAIVTVRRFFEYCVRQLQNFEESTIRRREG